MKQLPTLQGRARKPKPDRRRKPASPPLLSARTRDLLQAPLLQITRNELLSNRGPSRKLPPRNPVMKADLRHSHGTKQDPLPHSRNLKQDLLLLIPRRRPLLRLMLKQDRLLRRAPRLKQLLHNPAPNQDLPPSQRLNQDLLPHALRLSRLPRHHTLRPAKLRQRGPTPRRRTQRTRHTTDG